MKKKELEMAVRGTKGNVIVISTACYDSGSWTSQYWTLLAAAGENQLST
jgi:hypothetical protein